MLYESGRFPDALLYALLFMPTLSLVEDSVLLSDGNDDKAAAFREARKSSKMPLGELEACFNMRDIPYLFLDQNYTDEEESLLAEAIAEAWRRALAFSFPSRRFVVNIVPAIENGGDMRVEFQEIRG